MSRLFATWNLSPPVETHPLLMDSHDCMQGCWRDAVQAIAITAGVNILCNVKGTEQANMAAHVLIKQRAKLPTSLATDLDSLAVGATEEPNLAHGRMCSC